MVVMRFLPFALFDIMQTGGAQSIAGSAPGGKHAAVRLLRHPTMSAPPIPGIRACVFDAYGTLFDFAAAVAACRDAVGDKADRLTPLWRDKQLQYTWLRSLQRRHADFWQVTGDALDYALEALGIDDPLLRDRLMALYRTLDPFPEVLPVLKRLKDIGFVTAILSNGTPDMLAAAIDHAGISGLLDHVFSVEEVGIYKTAPQVYQLAIERLGVAASAVSFQSSNGWDVYAASAFGMRTVWCNRSAQPRERLPGAPDREIRTLAELPAILAPPLAS
jgi:2-haloacid dehalogenase